MCVYWEIHRGDSIAVHDGTVNVLDLATSDSLLIEYLGGKGLAYGRRPSLDALRSAGARGAGP